MRLNEPKSQRKRKSWHSRSRFRTRNNEKLSAESKNALKSKKCRKSRETRSSWSLMNLTGKIKSVRTHLLPERKRRSLKTRKTTSFWPNTTPIIKRKES